ncbi:MAG: diacylglycerol kinase [Planctomycetales bacterium]|nr:diacylglycerol kinase [Planctomycetales bacterium]MCA9168316.1 diacylglycerol kinase [Planctomycetales bacterium]
MTQSKPPIKPHDWQGKFLCAFRGLRVGSRGQSSFFVHLPMSCFVLAAAAQLRVTTIEWCVLVLCITGVLSTELMNAALESMARAITDEFHPEIRDALDIAAAAVLVAAIGAVVIGTLILGFRLGVYLGWWELPAYGAY